MLTIFGFTVAYETIAFAILFLFDEALPVLPIKGNNFTQMIHGFATMARFTRTEDDKIDQIAAILSSPAKEEPQDDEGDHFN